MVNYASLILPNKSFSEPNKKIESKISKSDIKTLEKINMAWKEIEGGKSKKYNKNDFKKKLLKGKL